MINLITRHYVTNFMLFFLVPSIIIGCFRTETNYYVVKGPASCDSDGFVDIQSMRRSLNVGG